MTSVVLADDQELVRSGLRALLQTRGIDVVGEAEHGRAAIEATRTHKPDVLLMDIRMPVMDGIAATREIVAQAASRPGCSSSPPTTSTSTSTRRCGQERQASCSRRAQPTGSSTPSTWLPAGEALLAPSLTRRLIAEHVRRPPPTAGIPP